MGTTAFAAGGNTITINNAKAGETYKIYKLLDLAVYQDDNGAPTYDGFLYTLNDLWDDFWTTGSGKDYIDTNTVGNNTYVVWKEAKKDAASMELFGKAAATYAKSITPTKDAITVPNGKTSIDFTGLDNGYYLITSTYGTAAIVESTPTNETTEITEKNNANTTEKKVAEAAERNGATASFGTTNDAAIGDTVTFRSKVTISKNSINVVYHDTMDPALTFSGVDNVKVYTDEACKTELAAGNYTVAAGQAPETFTVTFTNNYVASLTNATTDVYVKYTAVLNDSAVVGTEVKNTSKVTWGAASMSTESITTTTTHKFTILKYDAADTTKAPLANAKFKLYTVETGGTPLTLAVNTDGTIYRVVKDATKLPEGYTQVADNTIVTLSSGVITIEGVDSDDYYLEETEAPAGYNKLEGRTKVAVGAANSTVAEVENKSGTELPSTGGMGTTIFYVLGGLMVLGALVVLVTNKRMRAN